MQTFAIIASLIFSGQASASDLAVWKFKSNASINEQKAQFDEIVREAARKKLSKRKIEVIATDLWRLRRKAGIMWKSWYICQTPTK